MGKVGITPAGGDYEWARPLREGTVVPEGIDLNYPGLPVEEVFWRVLRHGEFDAAEMSLSSYVIYRSRGKSDLVALPVFPHRMFRHSFRLRPRRGGYRGARGSRRQAGRGPGVPTGIFPIVHTLVLQRPLYERHPWLAGSLYKAFDQARALGLALPLRHRGAELPAAVAGRTD